MANTAMHRHRAWHILVAIIIILACGAALVSCSSLRAPLTPPAKGGPPWSVVESPHFLVETDLDRPSATAVLQRLEASHAMLAALLRRGSPAREAPLEVVVFERASDFRHIAGEKLNAAAFFMPEQPCALEPKPLIVMQDSELVDEVRMVAQHELTHRFLRERFHNLPPWLNEGLAVYYESARTEGDRITLGAPASIDFSERPYVWLAWRESFEQTQVPLHLAPGLRQLIEADYDEFYARGDDGKPTFKRHQRTAAHYAAAWRLVHLLMSGASGAYRARFTRFLDELERGARPREAFLERFGDDWPGLERAYRAYLSLDRLQLAVSEVRVTPTTFSPDVRKLPDADLHLLWSRVMPWSEDNKARVREQLDAAIAASPDSIDALLTRAVFFMAAKDMKSAKASLDAVLAREPDDPRALFALIGLHRMRARAESPEAVIQATPNALVERLARTARTAVQLAVVARHYSEHGRMDEGLTISTRALAVDPLCWRCQPVHAVLLLAKGRRAEALAAVEQALTLAPEGASVGEVMKLREEILRAR